MTQAKAENYTLALDLVHAGTWRVDPELGLVYGKKGNPFRRTNSWGYIQIKFRDTLDYRVEHTALAHRVIWEFVYGSLAVDLTINHMNGIKQDNRLLNLEAITPADNVRHAFATGLNVPLLGMQTARARLTDEQVADIYYRAWMREPQRDIAADYRVGREIVSNIKRGWAWTHVTRHLRRRSPPLRDYAA